MGNFHTLLLTSFFVALLQPAQSWSFNVLKYGARGDGVHDDSKAFSDAWEAACGSSSGTPSVQIPSGKNFLLKPVIFKGPCKTSSINFQLQGTLIAPSDPSQWVDSDTSWLRFENVYGLTVQGNGKIDGRGFAWWEKCGKLHNCPRPTALYFHNTNNLKVIGLTHLNSQRNHISVDGSDTVLLSNLHIYAPETSPNTDGIDIANAKNIQITGCKIATGDDCVAINGGSSYIYITGMICGPGHGISVGSLGKGGEHAIVEEVHVKGCTFKGTTNGARIKTWKGGWGYVKKISYEDITLVNTKNPIIIDQFYSATPSKVAGNTTANDLSVNDVTFTGFRGTSGTKSAITLKCSSEQGGGCWGINIAHVKISSSSAGGQIYSTCQNAHGTSTDSVPSVDCLQS